MSGRYLASEPVMRHAQTSLAVAEQGRTLPVYAYAANSPLLYRDTDGRCPMCLAFGLVLLADAVADALVGTAVVGGVAAAAKIAADATADDVRPPGKPSETDGAPSGGSVMPMGKGGKQNHTDTGVMDQARNKPPGMDICDYLQLLYVAARAGGDNVYAAAIKKTQKALGCRGCSQD